MQLKELLAYSALATGTIGFATGGAVGVHGLAELDEPPLCTTVETGPVKEIIDNGYVVRSSSVTTCENETHETIRRSLAVMAGSLALLSTGLGLSRMTKKEEYQPA